MRRADTRIFPLLVAAILLAVPSYPVFADDQDDLKKVEQQIKADRERAEALERKRKKAAEELHNIRREAIASAKKAQQHEARLIELEARLVELSGREGEIRESLAGQRVQMTDTLAALQRMSRNPPYAMLAYPDAPTDMVRSALLLRAALPTITQEAESLSQELYSLAQVREETRLQLLAMEDVSLELEKQRQRLQAVLNKKSVMLRQTESERKEIKRRMAELSKRANSIRDLLAQIEEDRKQREEEARRRAEAGEESKKKPAEEEAAVARKESLAKPSGIRPFPVKGKITNPVSGSVITRYGARNKHGQTERGITFAARPGAQIVAPHDGNVAFAGPFEGYGQILIIAHDGGYHTLLAGLERLDTAVGQWVLAGEPVGAMGKSAIDKGGDTVGLYLELRRKGKPINPGRWIASGKQNRTSG